MTKRALKSLRYETPQDFKSMFGHFSTLVDRGFLILTFYKDPLYCLIPPTRFKILSNPFFCCLVSLAECVIRLHLMYYLAYYGPKLVDH